MYDFLANVSLPQLTVEQVSLLEASITTDKIAHAIASFARSKAPGSDGLPIEFYIEFYTQYCELLTPKLLSLYNYLFENFSLSHLMREALIVLITKPGKDPGYAESYRPLSLLQVDIKIQAKVLAICLNQVIVALIKVKRDLCPVATPPLTLESFISIFKLHMLM